MAACGSSSSSGSGGSGGGASSGSGGGGGKGSILIGLADDLSGPIAPYGKADQAAWLAAIKVTNDAGGINGRMLKLSSVDTQAAPDKDVAAVKRLAGNGAVVISGFTTSNDCAAAQSANRTKVVLDCGTAAPKQLIPVNSDVFVRNPLELQEMKPMNDMLKQQLGTVHYALLPANLAGELSWASYLKTLAEQTGGTVSQQILPITGSQAAQIAATLNAKPNVVVLETSPQPLTNVVKGLRQGGYTGPIINLTADYATAQALADPNLYVYNDTAFAIPGATPEVDKFVAALSAQGVSGADKLNETNLVNGYLNAMVTIAALKSCNGCEGDDLSKAMEKQNLELDGLTPKGGFGYSASSHIPNTYMEAYVYDPATKGQKLAYHLALTAPGDIPESALSE
jgi:ABC-type branched-subunit amino acid transport system substrate-binding protein